MTPFTAQPQREDLYEIVDIPVGAPPVGTDYSFAMPANSKCQILSTNFYLTTDVNLTDRIVGLVWHDALGNTALYINSAYFIKNNTFKWYSWSLGIRSRLYTTSTRSWDHPLPDDFYMFHNWTFRVYVWGIRAGDQITDLFIRYKRWITE